MATLTITSATTIFTPPASCTSHWTYEPEYYNSVPRGVLIQNAVRDFRDDECFPPGFLGFGRAPQTPQVYSPGACPVGYDTAGNTYNGVATTAICCPADFSYLMTVSNVEHMNTSAVFMGCISTYRENVGFTSVWARTDASNMVRTMVKGPLTMWAQPVSVAFRQADLTLFTTSTSETSTSSSSIASVRSSTSSQPTTTTSDISTAVADVYSADGASSLAASALNEPGINLSTGAIAGISIGGAAVVGLIIGIAIFFALKRRHARPPAYSPTPKLGSEKHEAGGSPYYMERAELEERAEWNSRSPQEMPSQEPLKGPKRQTTIAELG